MSEKVEKSVYDKLAGTSAVTTIVGTNIFYLNAPQGTALPYITINRVSTDAILTSSGPTATATTNVTDQVDMFGATYESVKLLADAVRATLFGWTDTGADPSISASLLTGERDELIPPATGTGVPVYQVSQDYSIWFSD